MLIPDERGKGIGTVLATQDDTALGAARAYLHALEQAATSLLKNPSGAITSLVPTPPSAYRDHMVKGDTAFRANNFHLATTEFRIAHDLGGRDAESLICLTHAQFALSRYSYAKAAYFFQLALKYMPELPLANLRPRGFYGSSAVYAENLVSLEDHLKRDPQDGEALLLLAYYRWFEDPQDVKEAQEKLSRALASAVAKRNTHLVEAVETFWDGMVATGKVSGELMPAAKEAGSGRPGGGLPGATKTPAGAH